MPVHLDNSIVIRSSPEAIIEAAYAVERWPDLLPHYRWVRVVRNEEPGRRIVEMAARRGWIPLKWTSLQWRDDAAGKVFFRHLRGPTRGMFVEWRIEPLESGDTRVTIEHELNYPIPWIGPLIAHYVVGELFIRPTARRTLACFKQILEQAG